MVQEPFAGEIPNKLYFKIGEVSRIVGVDPHVLRYWESEFKVIKPHRASSRQRLYRREDIDNLLRIRELLYDEGYTIAGARQALRQGGDVEKAPEPVKKEAGVSREFVSSLKDELQELKKMLED